MDNLCHTLVGAAMGEAGLKRRTRYGSLALIVSSNLPDLDALVFFTDATAVAFRRGWTHGIAAQLTLPVLLTGALVLAGRRAREGNGPPVRGWTLLALSYAGVFLHVFLDYLNTYGIRLLVPFDWRWFYGDAVFIVDPWLWLMLGAGVWLARRRHVPRAALTTLLAAACYLAAMLIAARSGRDLVADTWRAAHDAPPHALMVGPVPVTPFTREIIVDAGDHYETGVLTWWPAEVTFRPETVPKNAHRREVADAIAASARVRDFLVWSRFPYWTLAPAEGGTRVTVQDMRFRFAGRFSASVIVP